MVLKRIAQFAYTRLLKGHTDCLLKNVDVRCVDVRERGIGILVILCADVERTVRGPDFHLLPGAVDRFIRPQELVLGHRDPVVSHHSLSEPDFFVRPQR